MRLFAGLISLACFLPGLAGSAVAAPPPAAKHAFHAPARPAPQKVAKIKVAPADEYFGHLKMSILGIRNTLKDLAIKADYNPSNPEQIFGSAGFAEEALHEWEHKYPGDPWLAKTVAGLVHMYSRVPTAQGRAKMHAAFAWLSSRYGASKKQLVAQAKAEVDAADKAVVQPAEAATAPPPTSGTQPPASGNAPAAPSGNAPAQPKPPQR